MMVMVKGVCQCGVIIECKWQVDGYKWIGDYWEVIVIKMGEKGGNFVLIDEQIVIYVEYVVIVIGNYV